MKTGISAGLLAHYAQETRTLARLWRITRRDGEVFAFTDHDADIVYDGDTFTTTSAFDASAVKTDAAMSVDNAELAGLLAVDAITAADIEAGLWDAGTVELMEVNYADLSMGHNDLRFGEIGEVQRKGPGQYTAEIRGLMQYLQNVIGRTVEAGCDADLGDTRCGVDLEALRVSGTVTAAPSQRDFTASAMAQALHYFRYGVVTWTSGPCIGLSMEVRSFAVGGVFELQLDMPYAYAIGNTFTVVPGCDKVGRLGDCKVKFNNYPRFRGFEDLPGQTKIMLVGGQ